MPKQEPSGEAPDASVSGSQGVQVGSGNTMYASWGPKPPLDPVALAALNPHIAVARLQRLSHDELVDFFARASPGDVSEILDVFFSADLSKLVTALADISRRKATELIRELSVDLVAVLIDLPKAAAAIAREAARWRLTDAGPVDAYDGGYARRYEKGRIFWSEQFGVRTTVGAIDDRITDDEDHIPWGFPVGDQEVARRAPYGTFGVRQKFQSGMVYSSECGTFLVIEYKAHEDEGGSGGWLGFPVSERERNGQFGERQMFEGGAIYFYSVSQGVNAEDAWKSYAVHSAVANVLPVSHRWRPVSEQADVMSSSGNRGFVQHFELMEVLEISSETVPPLGETAVCWDEVSKPVMVAPEIWKYYCGLGAEKSWLGFPATPRVDSSRGSGGFQGFEGGGVYWQPRIGPIAVPAASLDFIRQGSLGFPVTEELPAGASGSDRIQFFDRGVVTMRDGKYEVWVRPDSKPNPDPEPGKAVPRAVPSSVPPAVPSAVQSFPTFPPPSRRSKPDE